MFESIVNFFKRIGKQDKEQVKSKDAAKERLHLVLMQDRANVSADFLDLMKQEIIEVIKKYIDVDENAIDVRLTNKPNSDGTTGAPALYANIPIVSIKEEAKDKEKASKEIEKNKQEDKKQVVKSKKEKVEKEDKAKKAEEKVDKEKVDEKIKEEKTEEPEEKKKTEKVKKEQESEQKPEEKIEENKKAEKTKEVHENTKKETSEEVVESKKENKEETANK